MFDAVYREVKEGRHRSEALEELVGQLRSRPLPWAAK
jgi:hypothetical protein